MKLQILSDIHLEFEPFDIPQADADLIILAGDIGIGTKGLEWAASNAIDKPVIYINGNHEYYRYAHPKLVNRMREMEFETDIYFLEKNECLIGDIRFLGCTLWTDFNLQGSVPLAMLQAGYGMNDFKLIRNSARNYAKFHPNDSLVIHRESLYWLEQCLKTSTQKTVVVTHHAPSIISIPDCYKGSSLNPAFASDLSELILSYQPALWVHGHLHTPSDYFIGTTRVICNPKGYPQEENTGFVPDMVVSI
jgi:predicted phosphodiesterase